MQPHDISRVEAVIDAHAERRSLQQLAQSGKQHLRVLSREKVLQLVQAIVEEAVAGSADASDRERIVEEAQAKLSEFTQRQAELEGAIQDRDARIARLEQELETERAQRDRQGEEQSAALQSELEETRQRLTTARETIENYDHEIRTMAEQTRSDERLLAELREMLRTKESELRASERQLAEMRTDAPLGEALDAVRVRVDALQQSMRTLADRPVGIDRDALDTLVAELSKRESRATLEMEDRFGASLQRALDEIGKTVRAATASPVETRVEATDLLVDRFFEDGAALESNSNELDVSESTSGSSIDGSLDRLRALRGAPAAADGPTAVPGDGR